MFVFAAAVPALLVVVLGYVLGHAVAGWVCTLLGVEPSRAPEVTGWITGLVLLGLVVRVLVGTWRRRRRAGEEGAWEEGHQK